MRSGGVKVRAGEVSMDLDALKDEVGHAIERLDSFEQAIFSAQDLISLLDAEGRYTAVNAAYAEAHARTSEEIVGSRPHDLFPLEVVREEIVPRLERCLAGEPIRYQAWFQFAGWGRRFVDVSYLPVGGGAAGASSAVAVMCRDITPLRRYADSLKQRNAELLELCANKDRLFSVVAHDLRSPLITFQSLFSALDGGALSTAEIAQLIQESRPALEAAGELLDDLLEWATVNLQGIDPASAPFDLREAVATKLRQLEPVAQRQKVELINDVEDGTTAFADRSMISVVLYNLMLNGIKFTPAGGSVHVSAAPEEGRVVVTVRDTGQGMPAERVQELFAAKQVVPELSGAEGGWGLGLFFCRELIEYNHGRIWATSEPDVGSEVCFSLLRDPPPEA